MAGERNDPEAVWPDARERLLGLMAGYIDGTVEVEAFCADFEEVYNLHLDPATLSVVEGEAFERIFDRTVWFSPLPDERARIPGYLGPEDIRATVQSEWSMLKPSAPPGST
jgi:hypothetical protein